MCNGVSQTAPCGPTYLPTPQPTENPTIVPVPVPTSAVSVDNLTRARLRQSRRRRSNARAPVARLKRLLLQVCADGRAHAVALRCADQQTVLHSDGCPERTAELAALVEAHVRTDVKTNVASLCQANEVERAPLNIVCLVPPPFPPHPPLP